MNISSSLLADQSVSLVISFTNSAKYVRPRRDRSRYGWRSEIIQSSSEDFNLKSGGKNILMLNRLRVNDMKAQKKLNKVTETSKKRLSQIYVAAAQLFYDKGYDATSMSDIAETVGMTKAGIYHFIPGGKKDLLFAVMQYGMDRLETNVITPALAIADAEQRLRSIVTNHSRLISSGSGRDGHNPVTMVVDEVAGLSPAQLRKITQRKRAYLDLVRGTLQQLKEEGKLKDVDVTVAAFSLFGMMLWLSRWFRPDGRLTSEQVSEEISKFALGGLLRPQVRLGHRG